MPAPINPSVTCPNPTCPNFDVPREMPYSEAGQDLYIVPDKAVCGGCGNVLGFDLTELEFPPG